MYSDSLYRKMVQSSDSLKNTGYDYDKNGLLDKFFSSRMFMNFRVDTFLRLINPIIINWTNSVKKIQFYTNYTVDKNERRINI
jgi:hypothetical protein